MASPMTAVPKAGANQAVGSGEDRYSLLFCSVVMCDPCRMFVHVLLCNYGKEPSLSPPKCDDGMHAVNKLTPPSVYFQLGSSVFLTHVCAPLCFRSPSNPIGIGIMACIQMIN